MTFVGAKIKNALHWLLAVLFLSPNSALAETKTFQREYTYQASEADSKLSARAIALEQVKRLLLEELGTYLESRNGKKYRLNAKIAADPEQVIKTLASLRQDKEKI